MALDKILKLGDPRLYQKCEAVSAKEVNELLPQIQLLHELILENRRQYGFGRGIAASQIGLLKRIICLNLDGTPYTLINPSLKNLSNEMFELWDDCMCFPNLLVKVRRHQSCTLVFKDEHWHEFTWNLENDRSELIQHEYDHLDGILATQRAIDDKSFKWKTI